MIDDMTKKKPGKDSAGRSLESVTWEEVGGCREAKQELKRWAAAIQHPLLYSVVGLKNPKGILLHGPPGNGKTLLAKALSSSCDADFRYVNCTDIGSKYINESAANVAEIFSLASQQAQEHGKCVVYFDEFDSLVAGRGESSSHREDDKVVSVFCTHLDGLDSDERVYVIASTNLPESIDTAITRPGRLDKIILVPLPDRQEREEIFRIHAGSIAKQSKLPIIGRIDYAVLAAHSEGYSGADIAAVCRRACEAKLWSLVKNFEKPKDLGLDYKHFSPVTTVNVLEQISKYDLSRAGSNPQSRRIGF